VFKRLAEAALRHLGVPPTINAAPPVLVVRNDPTTPGSVGAPTATIAALKPASAMPDASSSSSANAAALAAAAAAARDGLMPDVRGLSAREALRILATVGVEARLSGDGFVATQEIAPGTAIAHGQSCGLVLRRQLIPLPGDVGTQQ
jgi:hypothetical protein